MMKKIFLLLFILTVPLFSIPYWSLRQKGIMLTDTTSIDSTFISWDELITRKYVIVDSLRNIVLTFNIEDDTVRISTDKVLKIGNDSLVLINADLLDGFHYIHFLDTNTTHIDSCTYADMLDGYNEDYFLDTNTTRIDSCIWADSALSIPCDSVRECLKDSLRTRFLYAKEIFVDSTGYIGSDISGADSFQLYDDGDTTRLESDNPIKIGENSFIVGTDGLTTVDSIKTSTSIWYYCKYMDAINLAIGGSGAVQTTPTDNTLGGYQLDVATEYLYFNGGVCNNWDTLSDIEVKVRWELNAASGSANDSVFLDLICWYKGNDEDTTKYQALTEGVLVGNETQYTMHTTTLTIDYNLADNVVQKGDVFSFRLNLNTTKSDIDNVIVNFGRFRYKVRSPQPLTY